MKIETSRKFWTARLSHTHFWEMDTITVLQMFLGKWKSHTRMAQPSGNSDERRVWLVHASCIGFSPRLCSQAWKWSLRFTSMTSFLRWSMQTKWYGKSRNGVSFDRLACNRQKETLFLMPYYWDMKVWCATVSCRLDCAIKMELRVVAIKVAFSTDSLKLFRLTLWHYKISQIK